MPLVTQAEDSPRQRPRALLSLSRPVRDSSGNLVAILTLNGLRYRFGRDRIPDALQQLQATVDRLVEALWEDSASA